MTQSASTVTLLSFILYSLSCLLYGVLWVKAPRLARVPASALLAMGLSVNAAQLVARWIEADQPPFKTLYESLLLLAICIAAVYLVTEWLYRARALGLPSSLSCVLVILIALMQEEKDIVNLPPALQSGWFIPHVVIYFFGYAALFVAFGAALLYLIRPKPIVVKRAELFAGTAIELETLLDGAVRFGFVLLTVGLLIGAAWAKDAWGDYWVWDPKETWSLVTWLIFATYLHQFYLSQWRGRRLAFLVVIGFGAVLFTYLGMQLLPTADQSAHVYQ
jgi:cytochrome c-type biogenesis protein CcsB